MGKGSERGKGRKSGSGSGSGERGRGDGSCWVGEGGGERGRVNKGRGSEEVLELEEGFGAGLEELDENIHLFTREG